MTPDLAKRIRALLDSIRDDIAIHGGLVTRQTIRLSDELRLALSRLER